MPSRKLLVVFDIDETLIQYVSDAYISLWEEKKPSFPEGSYVEHISSSGKKNVVIFRPHLEKMIKLFKNDSFFVPALWTYSEREYCDFIAETIIRRYNLPEDFFLFRYGAEDIEEDEMGIPKNLSTAYRKFPQFNKFNTILIDDRYGNINNEINRYNGLCIQPFAPFGPEKKREQLNDRDFRKQMGDKMFDTVIKIAQAIKKDIEGCDEEDYEDAFATEAVFTEKRVKRMKLEAYSKTFAVKFTDVVCAGVPYLTKQFILIPDYHTYSEKMGGSKLIGGSKRKTIRGGRKQRKTRKSHT